MFNVKTKLCWLLLSLALLSFLPSNGYSLSQEKQERFIRNLKILLQFHPRYKWGAADKFYADCSGSLYSAAFDSGFPVLRTTALRMSLGADGWKSREVSLNSVMPGDLLFWWEASHTGVQYSNETIAHASSSKGFIEVDLVYDEWTGRDLFKRRRLVFGE